MLGRVEVEEGSSPPAELGTETSMEKLVEQMHLSV